MLLWLIKCEELLGSFHRKFHKLRFSVIEYIFMLINISRYFIENWRYFISLFYKYIRNNISIYIYLYLIGCIIFFLFGFTLWVALCKLFIIIYWSTYQTFGVLFYFWIPYLKLLLWYYGFSFLFILYSTWLVTIEYAIFYQIFVIFSPLIGFLFVYICSLIIKKIVILGSNGLVINFAGIERLLWFVSRIIIIFFMFVSVFCAFTLFYCFVLNGYGNISTGMELVLFPWFQLEFINVFWVFYFDTLSCVMLFVVSLISFAVHIYSFGYIADDPSRIRFISYLSLFTFFMFVLVTAGNFVVMFLGWEGVGLCSYLLIGFWHTRVEAGRAAMKAIIINRLGDVGILLGLVVLLDTFKSLDYLVVFSGINQVIGMDIEFCGFFFDRLTLICTFLFIGAMAKSAQLGLHTWLPDAMEGPTPVSALIHAATMVTAGIFLIVRCSPLMEFAGYSGFDLYNILSVIMIVGALTGVVGGLIGMVQNDLKKVIAYSTCSQLGYMILACGMSNYALSMFHLTNHAFFKALLFLGAGSVIHALSNEQDMRRMGGLVRIMPITYISILIGSVALMGIPFLSGFYSKDIIIEVAYNFIFIDSYFFYWLSLIAVFCTAFYSIRIIYLTFFGSMFMSRRNFENVHESNFWILGALIFLGLFSIFSGFYFKDMFIGLGSTFWQNSIFVLYEDVYILESEFIPGIIKILPFILTLIGGFISFKFVSDEKTQEDNFKSIVETTVGRNLFKFFYKKLYFDQIYSYFIAHKLMRMSFRIGLKGLDQGIISYIGPVGLLRYFNKVIKLGSILQTGHLYHYLLIILVISLLILISNFINIIGFLIVGFFLLFTLDLEKIK